MSMGDFTEILRSFKMSKHNVISVFSIIFFTVLAATGSETGQRVKRVRANSGTPQEPAQALDAPDPTPSAVPAPTAFLSPSVKEYLELGVAIPGSETGQRVKRVRANSGTPQEPAQALDAPDPTPSAVPAPTAFLSPSVKEYLELGVAIPGKPGTDYPVLGAVPYTNFYCDEQPYPGFFADMETRCQAWHYCDIDGRQASFLCPNGTIFSQGVASCDWWFNVRCALSPALYPLNARLYRRRKKQTRPKPHRVIDKKLVDEIFL